MLDHTIFASADAAVEAAGSSDPRAVMEKLRIMHIALKGSITGYATRVSYLAVIGINENLSPAAWNFTAWHELTHVLEGDIDDPAFIYRFDRSIFTEEVDSRTIARREKICNLVSADRNVDTGRVREMIGYDNPVMADYRRLCAHQEETVRAYEALRLSAMQQEPPDMLRCRLADYQKQLQTLEQQRYNLEAELLLDSCSMTLSQIAGELGITKTILKYKLEAMRLRGLDIKLQELESFDKVFEKLA